MFAIWTVSKRFYLDVLGFELRSQNSVYARPANGGSKWRLPDGSAESGAGGTKARRAGIQAIGGYRWVLFMTEDVHAKYKEWSERGVRFLSAPRRTLPGWGGTYARFEDPDGNAFGLEGFDEVRRSLESRRRAHAEKLEAERRMPRNWKSPGRCRRGCFRSFNRR